MFVIEILHTHRLYYINGIVASYNHDDAKQVKSRLMLRGIRSVYTSTVQVVLFACCMSYKNLLKPLLKSRRH